MGLQAWIQSRIRLGTYKHGAARLWITAVDQLASVLADNESRDLDEFLQRLPELADRWTNLGKGKPATATEYERRVRRVARQFIEYRKAPSKWQGDKEARGGSPRVRATKRRQARRATAATDTSARDSYSGQYPLGGGRSFRFALPESGIKMKDAARIAYHLVTLANDWDPTMETAQVFSLARTEQ